jgi:hypothetical protein
MLVFYGGKALGEGACKTLYAQLSPIAGDLARVEPDAREWFRILPEITPVNRNADTPIKTEGCNFLRKYDPVPGLYIFQGMNTPDKRFRFGASVFKLIVENKAVVIHKADGPAEIERRYRKLQF